MLVKLSLARHWKKKRERERKEEKTERKEKKKKLTLTFFSQYRLLSLNTGSSKDLQICELPVYLHIFNPRLTALWSGHFRHFERNNSVKVYFNSVTIFEFFFFFFFFFYSVSILSQEERKIAYAFDKNFHIIRNFVKCIIDNWFGNIFWSNFTVNKDRLRLYYIIII